MIVVDVLLANKVENLVYSKVRDKFIMKDFGELNGELV
jgi:hypothetical protein